MRSLCARGLFVIPSNLIANKAVMLFSGFDMLTSDEHSNQSLLQRMTDIEKVKRSLERSGGRV